MKIERMRNIPLDHKEYLEFINGANRDNDDWVPFDSIESLKTFLFLDPEYDANKHFVMMINKAIVADLFIRIRSLDRSIAEIALNIAMDWRGKGLGEKLLLSAIALLNQTIDIIRIILSPGNREILPFAKRQGFKVLRQIDLIHDLKTIKQIYIPSGYQIQLINKDQIEEVTALRNQIFSTTHRVEEGEALLKEGGVILANILVATTNTEIIGYCIAQKDSRTPSEEGLITEIGVRQEHRKKGIGKAMLLMNLDWLKSKGCVKVTVNAKSRNIYALKLYKGTGFRAFRIKEKILEKRRK